MKPSFFSAVIICGLVNLSSVYADDAAYGARLVRLVDLGVDEVFESSGRSVDLINDSFIGISGADNFSYEREEGFITLLDFEKGKVMNHIKFGANVSYYLGPSIHDELLAGYYLVDSKKPGQRGGTRNYRMSFDGRVEECTEDYLKISLRKDDDHRSLNYNPWPKELPLPDGVLKPWTLKTFEVDWTLYKNKLIILNEQYVGAQDASRETIGVYRVDGSFLFRIPYAMMPGGGDDEQRTSVMNVVSVAPGGAYLMVNAHAMSYDIYPELKGKEPNRRREFIWIYELPTEEEWLASPRDTAKVIKMRSNLESIVETYDIPNERFNVHPGTYAVYGLRGYLNDDNVNLRDEPSLRGKVITKMTMASHFKHFKTLKLGFLILEKSQHKDTISGVTDYWYRIFFQFARDRQPLERYEGWVFGAFINIYDPTKSFEIQVE